MNRSRLIAMWMALAIATTGAGCREEPGATSTPPPPILATNPAPPAAAAKIQPVAPELGLTVKNYPAVDGSTSAQPLLLMTACKILAAGYEWVHSEQDDSRRLWASSIAEEMQGRFGNRPLCDRINRLVQAHGTGEAYVHLIRKSVDLILAARPPSDDEKRLTAELGVTLDARPVALDAFIFLLNTKNPVSGLSIAQIRDIYSGRVVNWRAVGGPDAPIRPYQRTRNSGSQELMQKLVMKDRHMIPSPDLLIETLMSYPFLAIDQDVHGIGYSVDYYREFMAPRTEVKACAVAGVLPTSETIRARRYPFVTEVYVVVRRDLPADHPARRLRDWMLGPTGQGIVEESGYVPVPEPSTPGSPEDSIAQPRSVPGTSGAP